MRRRSLVALSTLQPTAQFNLEIGDRDVVWTLVSFEGGQAHIESGSPGCERGTAVPATLKVRPLQS